MKLVRRYWGAGLILLMVAVHAAVIGYVRSRVARLSAEESSALEVGRFRIQPVTDPSKVYQFRLHALIDPSKLHLGKTQLKQMRMEIWEDAEQQLRLAEPKDLHDPEQVHIRELLTEAVRKHMAEQNIVQRVLITDWLELPVVGAAETLLNPQLADNH